jgi:hypothetical protein
MTGLGLRGMLKPKTHLLLSLAVLLLHPLRSIEAWNKLVLTLDGIAHIPYVTHEASRSATCSCSALQATSCWDKLLGTIRRVNPTLQYMVHFGEHVDTFCRVVSHPFLVSPMSIGRNSGEIVWPIGDGCALKVESAHGSSMNEIWYCVYNGCRGDLIAILYTEEEVVSFM